MYYNKYVLMLRSKLHSRGKFGSIGDNFGSIISGCIQEIKLLHHR